MERVWSSRPPSAATSQIDWNPASAAASKRQLQVGLIFLNRILTNFHPGCLQFDHVCQADRVEITDQQVRLQAKDFIASIHRQRHRPSSARSLFR